MLLPLFVHDIYICSHFEIFQTLLVTDSIILKRISPNNIKMYLTWEQKPSFYTQN